MMRTFFFTLIFFLSSISVFGQESMPEYMANTLIIKFKNEQQAESFKAKSGPGSVLQTYGIYNIEPVLSTQVQSALKSKSSATSPAGFAETTNGLNRIYSLEYSTNIDPVTLGAKLSRLPEVEYAEPRYLYYTSLLLTNDPIQNDFVNYHRFGTAWDISTSSDDVIISIVDSGVNYEHEDLENKKWVNENEIPDNGLDDDNNGFVDDYLGWDFWESGYTNQSITQDNDPFAGNSDHGTHVAGIATAEPNNGNGLAGTGFNARYMAVKAGGPPDNPLTTDDERRAIGFGYEGILYSYIMGADIINCSWGGPGFSLFGQDIVNTVTEGGAIIIAAAGNENTETPHYPSGYKQVFSVGSVGNNNVRSDFSNYGIEVDVFATGIVQSSNGFEIDGYATYGGTSMSSPVVAGLAALLITEFPTWSPERIKAQIRSSATSIDASNPDEFSYKLGTGSINAERALSTPLPGIRVDSVHYLNSNGLPINFGETGIARIFLYNAGQTGASLSLSVTPLDNGLTFLNEDATIGDMPQESQKIIEIPIQLNDAITTTLSSEIRVEFFDNSVGYADFDFLEFNDLQTDFSTISNIALSFSPNGRIGFFDASTGAGGIGYVPYPDTSNFLRDNLLFEGGIILQANNTILNNVRGSSGNYNDNFTPVSAYQVFEKDNNSRATGVSEFMPSPSSSVQNIEIQLTTNTFSAPELENSIVLNYTIRNTSSTLSLSEVYLGVFNDWDIGDFSDNNVFYNQENDLLIIEEDGSSEKPKVSVFPFANTSSVLAIDNAFEGNSGRFEFGLFDDFTLAEKRNALIAGTNYTSVEHADISTVVATGPYYIPPNENISVGFIYTFGETESELIEQANAARALPIVQNSESNSNPANNFPESTLLFQNYPNPFNPTTTIRFNLSQRDDVRLEIYNSIGQKVRTILNTNLLAGIHTYQVSMDEFSSGLYFALLEAGNNRELIKLMLIK